MLSCISSSNAARLSAKWHDMAHRSWDAALMTLSPALAWPVRDSEHLCPFLLLPFSSSQDVKVSDGHGGEAERCFVLPVSCCRKFVPLCPKRLMRNSHYCWCGPPSSSHSWHVCWKCASWSVGGLTAWLFSPHKSKKTPRALFCPLLAAPQRTATGAWYG